MKTVVKNIIFTLTAISLMLVIALPAGASSVYVSGANIHKYNDDGSYIATNFSSPQGSVSGIADDPLNSELYLNHSYSIWQDIWRDNETNLPYDSNLGDFDNLADVTDTSNQLNWGNMDFDPLSRNLFYLQRHTTYGNPVHYITTMNVDTGSGTNVYNVDERRFLGWTGCCGYERKVYEQVHSIADVAVDPLHEYVYWTDSTAGSVNRLNLNGTGIAEELYTGLSNPNGIALDANSGVIFWTEQGNSANSYDSFIQFASTTGTGSPTPLLSFDGSDHSTYYGSIDVDPDAGKIYFLDHTTGYQQGSGGAVRTMDYSGQNVQNFTTPTGSMIYGNIVDVSSSANLAVVPEPISSTLFIVGGATLGFRRFRKKFTK